MKGAQNRRCLPNVEPEVLVDADLDTLATALYVRTDDLLKDNPHPIPWRPKVGITPVISDAEMVTLSVMQALLGYTSEARWLRFAHEHLRHLFPYLPKQPGYNKRLRRLAGDTELVDRCLGPQHQRLDRRRLGRRLHTCG